MPQSEYLASEVRNALAFLRGASLPPDAWEAVERRLRALSDALAAGDVGAAARAVESLQDAGSTRVLPLPTDPSQGVGRPRPEPVSQHVNLLIGGVEEELERFVSISGSPG